MKLHKNSFPRFIYLLFDATLLKGNNVFQLEQFTFCVTENTFEIAKTHEYFPYIPCTILFHLKPFS